MSPPVSCDNCSWWFQLFVNNGSFYLEFVHRANPFIWAQLLKQVYLTVHWINDGWSRLCLVSLRICAVLARLHYSFWSIPLQFSHISQFLYILRVWCPLAVPRWCGSPGSPLTRCRWAVLSEYVTRHGRADDKSWLSVQLHIRQTDRCCGETEYLRICCGVQSIYAYDVVRLSKDAFLMVCCGGVAKYHRT